MTLEVAHRPPTRNHLLDLLSNDDYGRLLPHLRPTTFLHGQVIYQEWQQIDTIYFPTSGILSAILVTIDGHGIEVANVGREGVSGVIAVFGMQPSLHKLIAQVAGEGLRIELAEINRLAEPGGTMHRLLLRYMTSFLSQVSQSVACNGLHRIKQRCCRWLLMTHDRIDGDEITLTHEFLGIMLGVRRASVTEVLNVLQNDGLIRNSRKSILVLDRLGLVAACCECYAKVETDYARLLG